MRGLRCALAAVAIITVVRTAAGQSTVDLTGVWMVEGSGFGCEIVGDCGPWLWRLTQDGNMLNLRSMGAALHFSPVTIDPTEGVFDGRVPTNCIFCIGNLEGFHGQAAIDGLTFMAEEVLYCRLSTIGCSVSDVQYSGERCCCEDGHPAGFGFCNDGPFAVPSCPALCRDVAFPVATPTPAPTPTPTAVPCPGDCDRSGRVTIAEIVAVVADSVNGTAVCASADADGNGRIDVNEIVTAVRMLLDGCPAALR